MGFGGGVFGAVEVVEESGRCSGSGGGGGGGGGGSGGGFASSFEFFLVFHLDLDLARFSSQHF